MSSTTITHSQAKSYFAWKKYKTSSKTVILCASDADSAINYYLQLKFYMDQADHKNLIFFPELDTVPYDRVSPASEIAAKRANALTQLATSKKPKIIVTSAKNLIGKLPPLKNFQNKQLILHPKLNISSKEIVQFLVNNGFTRSASAVDSGEFAVRGEIIDIVDHSGSGLRIQFEWDKVECIKEFDTYSQVSSAKLDIYTISCNNETLLNAQTIQNFKDNFLHNFGVNHINHPLYESIMSEKKFQGFENLFPLFYAELTDIFEYASNHSSDYSIIYNNLCVQSIMEHEHSYNDFYEARQMSNKTNPESFYFALQPEEYIISSDEAKTILGKNGNFNLSSQEVSEKSKLNNQLIPNIELEAKRNKQTEIEYFFTYLNKQKKKIAVISCNSRASREKLKAIIDNNGYKYKEIKNHSEAKKNVINITSMSIESGFIADDYIFFSEKDIFGQRFASASKKSSKKKLQNILTEIDNIKEGEFITHKEYGVGIFEKIETLTVNEVAHDCLKINYDGGDVFYLPVENIDQIKKFGSDDATLDRLGSTAWQKRTAKLKDRIKDIAAKLIKISAKRAKAKTRAVVFEQESYDKFCKKFPYNETDDQQAAIDDAREDLESGKLMDRLICGDVGFGKTEVALRAAFMAAFDIEDNSPQIAVISPTTILCKQHFQNFIERFRGMGLNIKQLSRLVKPAEAKKVKDGLADGSVNIVVGTHALLNKNIKFSNLKMIIIDEEQHFGVAQKEHLKSLKSNVHVLTLSATPIPRTLQMSMVGIKDLSLIATPPIDRLPVRTNVMPFDPIILRDALMRERFRGGLSFYVAPRIKDIEWISKQLTNIVPELKFQIAHGQMNPAKIDEIMNDFCDGKFDILLSTTIIESGIDIPIANTMIIHKADMLGLSQLYQLRGRVGRGKLRGHAYLTLDHRKKIKKHSVQRLDLLQNIETLGAGFTIASHDMDLRGFGNLVGDEQSGHIKEVGAELYNDMLQKAIEELQENEGKENDKAQNSKPGIAEISPVINLGLSVLIPADYIDNSSLRLAIYRRAGELADDAEIEEFENEMIDRFGPIPKEFLNLLQMVRIKQELAKLKIAQLDSGPGGFSMKFANGYDISEMVMSFIQKFPRHAKARPDNKLVYMVKLNSKNIIEETKKLINNLGK